MALSSAILYLAIVAIWAIVLVPRWLRPPQASGTLESNLAEPVAASPLEDLAEAEEDAGGEKGLPDPGARAAAGARARPPAAERRARILQARRRMLVTLTVLTAGAVGIAVTRLAASWVVIPPAVMLAGFVLLLREAARSDAERAFEAAWRRERTTDADAVAADGPDRQQTGPADGAQAEVASPQAEVPSPQAGVPSAQIIDISGRVGDQLYDQYADAEVRAVGD
jgi:hypothetical protein